MRFPSDRTSRFAVSLAAGFALELLGVASGGAATFVVNQSYDAVDLALGDGQCDAQAAAGLQCTLRAAVQQARGTAEGDKIYLPAGTVFLSILGPNEDFAATGDLDLWGDVEIYGSLDLPRSVIDIADGWNDRLFETAVPGGDQIRLFNIEMRGGKSVWGGALLVNGDHVSVEYCVLTGNEALDGGAIFNLGGELTLVGSSLVGNHASARGGGLFHQSLGVTVVDQSLFTGNTAGENGAGIFASQGFSMTNSTVSGNATNGSGGGVWISDGDVELRNVSIVGNVANFDSDDFGLAGGIVVAAGTTTITNSIVADNVAFVNSDHDDCWGNPHTLVSGGWTLVEEPCAAYDAAPSDLNGVDPELGPLAYNGGLTKTHRPLGGSPVLDRGNPAVPGSEPDACAAVDQRNAPRPVEGTGFGVPRCDMGAVEFEGYLFADGFESGDVSRWN